MESKTAFFDVRAGQWEQHCYPDEQRNRLQELIQAFGVVAGESVLDLGTGPGILIPYLRDRLGTKGRICALDLSFPMVRQAAKKPLSRRDRVLQADVQDIPFQQNCFDRLICFAAFPHFPDPQGALQEMARVLKPGGTLVIAHLMSRAELNRHHQGHAAVAGDRLPDDRQMAAYFRQAGLSAPEIVNRPGRYVAQGRKVSQAG